MVRNPYYPSLVTEYRLDSSVVDVIGFCTKNPAPFFPYMDDLKSFRQFWSVSITAFGKDIEPNVPHVDKVIESFRELSKTVGRNAIVWRDTPIILTPRYPLERHIRAFEYIANALEGYTDTAIFGFLDLYDRLQRMHPELHDATDEEKIILAKAFQQIAEKHHMALRLCSKEKWLKDYGIDVDGCMRLEDYEKAAKVRLKPKTRMQARKGYCSCLLSNDIGAYNSCLHLCRYCYANSNENILRNNFTLHDDNSPFLIGVSQEGDLLRKAKQESWIVD